MDLAAEWVFLLQMGNRLAHEVSMSANSNTFILCQDQTSHEGQQLIHGFGKVFTIGEFLDGFIVWPKYKQKADCLQAICCVLSVFT